jgi:peptide/nickel transport system ATP-binding protein
VNATPGTTLTDQTDDALTIAGLSVTFTTESGDVPAVREVSLRIRPGETVALVGESGSGKTTVAQAAMALLPENASVTGQIDVAAVDVSSAAEPVLRTLRGNTMSMVFQEPATALDPLMRVGAQIAEVIRNHRDISAGQAAQEAVDLLRRVGIPDPERRARAYPFQLSGGQRQRVVIAMAVANRPALLVADEPTTALDVTVQAEILRLLRTLIAESGTALLLVTHNMGVVADIADRVAVMLEGAVVETGPVEQVLLHPQHDYTKALLKAVPALTTTTPEPARPSDPLQPAHAAHPAPPGDESPAAPPAVSLHDISVSFGRGAKAVHALTDVSLAVAPGETLGLIGESGSGKSTAARVALGLIRPTEGHVTLFGADPSSLRGRARRALGADVGVVLQDPVASLDARMSVAQCIAEPLRVHRRGMSAKERGDRVAEYLERVRLPRALASRAPRELSGGQRQRVSLARALVLGPKLLVADEPTSALDVSVQRSVLEVLAELQHELGFGCLFVSHDLAVVQDVAHRVVVLHGGRVEEQGPTADVLSRPASAYTRRLVAAVPTPDPVAQRSRRDESDRANTA